MRCLQCCLHPVHDLQCQQQAFKAIKFKTFLCWNPARLPKITLCATKHRSVSCTVGFGWTFHLYPHLYLICTVSYSAKVRRLRKEKCKSKLKFCFLLHAPLCLCVCASVLSINWWERCHAFHPTVSYLHNEMKKKLSHILMLNTPHFPLLMYHTSSLSFFDTQLT